MCLSSWEYLKSIKASTHQIIIACKKIVLEQTNSHWRSLPLVCVCTRCVECRTHNSLPLHYVWNLDQLGYAGLRARRAGRRVTRGPCVLGRAWNGRSECGSPVFPQSGYSTVAQPCPAPPSQQSLSKQEATTPGRQNKRWIPSQLTVFVFPPNYN